MKNIENRLKSYLLGSTDDLGNPDRKRKALRATAAGSILATLALTGCSASGESDDKPGSRSATGQVASEQVPTTDTVEMPTESPTKEPLDAITEVPIDTPSDTKVLDLATLIDREPKDPGACGPEEARHVQELAEACLDFYEDGNVAIVNYGSLSDKEAAQVANDLEEYVNSITRGLVRTSFEAIPASEAAKSLLKQQNPETCTTVGGGDFRTGAAWAADVTMFEDLEGVDKIIGLNPYSACDGPPSRGAAYYDKINRYAEVIGDEKDPKWAFEVAAHEFFHFLGLDHSGVVEHSPNLQLETLFQEGETTIDLRAYLEGDGIKYRPYGNYAGISENSIMGDQDPNHALKLSATEMHALQLPFRIAGEQPDPDIAVAVSSLEAGSTAEFTDADQGKKYAQLKLDAPFSLQPDDEGQPNPVAFDKLTFTPDRDPSTGQLAINLRLLAQEDNTSAVIGQLIGPGEFTFDIDGDFVTVTINDQSTKIEFSR